MLQNFVKLSFFSLLIILSNSCKKDPASGANVGGTSSYAFAGAPSACSAPVIAGLYNAGMPMSAANTLTFTVNVTVKGTYSMNTTSANGVWFSGSGVFPGTGNQTVVLTGNGIPAKMGSFAFVPVTNNTCSFSVSFGAGAPAAIFTYAGAPGNCTAPAVNGTYASGISLGAANYVDLAVNVTTPGAYTINTNSANGIGFSGSGVFTAVGPQVVRLIGNGTPAAAGTNAYRPTGGCSFNITVTPPAPPAAFTYNGAPGACTTPGINGTYMAGVPLNATNTIVLGVNVTVVGPYSVSTNNANGVVFSGSGNFTTLGANTITLTSTNTPTTLGPFNYTPAGGCLFTITYTAGLPSAAFTYNGAPGSCTSPVISGTFAAGTALTASSTITLGVNVTTTGLYSVSTNSSNGVTFSASGVFLTTGPQTITFTSNNTPTAAGSFNYTPTGGCIFSITYTGGGGGGGDFLRCTIDGTPMDFSTGLSGLLFGGSFTSRGFLGNARFDLELNDNLANIAVGTYDKYSLANQDKYCDVTYWPNFVTGPGNFWAPWSTNPNPFTVTVQTLTTTPRKITGIFSGDVFDFLGGNRRVITAGSFSITY